MQPTAKPKGLLGARNRSGVFRFLCTYPLCSMEQRPQLRCNRSHPDIRDSRTNRTNHLPIQVASQLRILFFSVEESDKEVAAWTQLWLGT